MQNATFNAVFESTNTNSAAEQNVVKTFSTKLPNGNKLTINSTPAELNILADAMADIPKEDKPKAKADVQEELVQNTIAADEADVTEQVTQMAAKPAAAPQYVTPEKWEFTVAEDDANIQLRSRDTYVWQFKAQQRRTAVASLQMCRVVYEANKMLVDHDFLRFCESIGYKSDSSTVRKFLAIGRVYPRLIQYADQLPAAWTSIYALTQMPADDFERCIADGYRLCDLSTAEIDDLVKKTRVIKNLVSPFKKDKKEVGTCVAKVFFTKVLDDTDLRLLKKAFAEISLRMPVELRIEKKIEDMYSERAAQRYSTAKKEAADTAVKPENWDYGTAANSVYAQKAA
jgi:hypothetical protein